VGGAGVTLWDRKRTLNIFCNQVNQHSDTVTVGAFHVTEIPEISLENQMEHVNFWNAVSKIPDNLSRLSTNWKFRNFRNFYIPAIKTFPNQRCCFPKVFLSKNRHQNGGFSTILVPRVWIYFAECRKKRFERQCQILRN
jgi:hypothetical protein